MSTTLQNESQPAWEIARLFPDQGKWCEGDYLTATQSTNCLVEFSNGHVEVLPMPKTSHQLIVQYLSNLLLAFVSAGRLGTALFAPLRVRLPRGSFREPDVVFMLAANAQRIGEDYWEGADLVMEVVSDDNRAHDLSTKRAEYAEAGIPEYWIVDPREQRITVLTLQNGAYRVSAEVGPGEKAASVLLAGFAVEVKAVFDAAAGPR